jgi:hypothetical protein
VHCQAFEKVDLNATLKFLSVFIEEIPTLSKFLFFFFLLIVTEVCAPSIVIPTRGRSWLSAAEVVTRTDQLQRITKLIWLTMTAA